MQQYNSERFGGPDTPEDELKKRADFGFEAKSNPESAGDYAEEGEQSNSAVESGEQVPINPGLETGAETTSNPQLSPESVLDAQTEPESEADSFIAAHVGGDREVTADTAAEILNDLLDITQKSETK
jgi:hypothetical protein